MKTITDLKGKLSETDLIEPRGVLQAVYDEPRPGLIRQVSLGSAAVVLSRDTFKVAIPLAELWKLAERHEPDLMPKKEKAAVQMEKETR